MKISILTQPLGHNYGGLMQAYALQTYLRGIGCEVETLDRRPSRNPISETRVYLINLLRLLLGRVKSVPTRQRHEYVFSRLADFRDRNLVISSAVTSDKEMRQFYQTRQFDALIVGSDQVWRPRYSPGIYNFYLDFLDDVGQSPLRVSYAASFGVDEWEYTPAETIECAKLIERFDAVSVREPSAIVLCESNLGRKNVECVVDPTLLLSASDYRRLIDANPSGSEYDGVLTYILNRGEMKSQIAQHVADSLGVDTFSIKPEVRIEDVRARFLESCRYPGVEQWLKGFRDAKFVVTDSFHGCVFSIIFNTPFIALDNPVRGTSRIFSLLQTFGLQDRLITTLEDFNAKFVSEAIDWNYVNSIREIKSGEGKAFLEKSLAMRAQHG